MKTLKVEEVDGRRYRNVEQAKSSIGEFIEEIYNQQRLHSALDYRSPAKFEAEAKKRMRPSGSKTSRASMDAKES